MPSVHTSLTSFLMVFAAIAGTIQAGQVRPVNLQEMTQQATTIFSGRCIAVDTRIDPHLDRRVTVATFEVDRSLKGEPGDRFQLKMLDSSAGLPRFRAGEQVVLFLHGESDVGLSSPVGLGQGKFSIVEDKFGEKLAINEFGNKNLMRGMPEQARSLGERGIEATALLDLVESLQP